MGPFDLLPPQSPDRRGREPEVNAWIELHNVIVAAERADDFGPEDLDRIYRQRQVDLGERFLDQRIELYQQFLEWTLEDGDFSEGNRELLAHLADTLALEAVDLRATHQRAFGNVVHQALADDCLSIDQRLLLYKLQHTLGLNPELADGAFEVMARERLLVTVARVLCDGELSPEEAKEVEKAQANLSVAVPTRVTAMLNSAAQRWLERHPSPKTSPEASGAAVSTPAFPGLSTEAIWRVVDTERLGALFGDKSGRRMDPDTTFHYRVPAVVMRGTRARGRISVAPNDVTLLPRSGMPKTWNRASLVRALRFQNGVMLDFTANRTLFIQSDDDARLHRALAELIRTPHMDDRWAARWRPLYAPEREVALGRVSSRVPEHERPSAALGKLLGVAGWSAIGDVHLHRDSLTLHSKTEKREVSIRNLRGVHIHRRLVWIDRNSGHDWVLEFTDEAEAESFVRGLT